MVVSGVDTICSVAETVFCFESSKNKGIVLALRDGSKVVVKRNSEVVAVVVVVFGAGVVVGASLVEVDSVVSVVETEV
jgi:hypothetical protein